MKKAEIFIYSLFAVGIILKLFKLPMHTIFILVTLLIILIYYVFCLISKNKDLYSSLTGLVTFVWLFCLLAILKHFPFKEIVWIVAILSSIALLILLFKNKKIKTANSLFCAVIIAITVFFRFLPSHHTYFLTNIKFNYQIETDYFSWDKYSWFLYSEGKQEEAIEANRNALKAVELSLKNAKHGDENEYLTFIKEHELEISHKTWTKYP